MENSRPDRALKEWSSDTHRLVYNFKDIEEAQRHLAGNYSAVQIKSENGTSFDLACAASILGNVAFTSNASKSGLAIKFETPFDGYGISLLKSGSMLLNDDSKRRTDSMSAGGIIVDSLSTSSARFSPQSNWRRIMIPSEQLHQRIAMLTEQPVRHRVKFLEDFNRNSFAYHSIMAIDDVIANGMNGEAPLLRAPAAFASLKDAILSMFVENITHSYTGKLTGRPRSIAPRHVKRAIEFMHANLLSPLTLEDLAGAAGVSARSLQLGFRQVHDMSPMDFLRRLRLHEAHRDLAEAPFGTSVANIAYKWGFAHHGLFSANYKKMFGVSPSSTLRKII